jgi:glyoxylate/succinic semialdehyde reductase
MGKRSLLLGAVGAGARMKLVVNMTMGAMMAAFCEGMSLADKSGLRQEDLLEVGGALRLQPAAAAAAMAPAPASWGLPSRAPPQRVRHVVPCGTRPAATCQVRLLPQVLSLGAMANPMFSLKGPALMLRDYPPAFPLKHQQKDLRLAIALGDKLQQSLPVSAAANEQFKAAMAKGLGDQDFAAVYEATQAGSSSSSGGGK